MAEHLPEHDIVTRLKTEAREAVACEHESFLVEAAIEIERLRDALMLISGMSGQPSAADVARLTLETEVTQ